MRWKVSKNGNKYAIENGFMAVVIPEDDGFKLLVKAQELLSDEDVAMHVAECLLAEQDLEELADSY